jgi:hypothetical protein
MLHPIINLLILTLILSGCGKKNYKSAAIYKPQMPIAGVFVADELSKLCIDNKCYNLNNYLNKLYLFKMQYDVFYKNNNS